MNHNMMLLCARSAKAAAEVMTAKEMDAWYLEHVGYSLLEDNPDYTRKEMVQMVAASMFYDTMPEGVDTQCDDVPITAGMMEAEMCRAICKGYEL